MPSSSFDIVLGKDIADVMRYKWRDPGIAGWDEATEEEQVQASRLSGNPSFVRPASRIMIYSSTACVRTCMDFTGPAKVPGSS